MLLILNKKAYFAKLAAAARVFLCGERIMASLFTRYMQLRDKPEKARDGRNGKTHNIVIIADDTFNEQCTWALNSIGTGFIQRVAGGNIAAYKFIRKLEKFNIRPLYKRAGFSVFNHGNAGIYGMDPSGKGVQH